MPESCVFAGLTDEQIKAGLARLSSALGDVHDPAAVPLVAALMESSDDSSEVDDCPECVQGKHDNCDGVTWDQETDTYADCPCYLDGHGHR